MRNASPPLRDPQSDKTAGRPHVGPAFCIPLILDGKKDRLRRCPVARPDKSGSSPEILALFQNWIRKKAQKTHRLGRPLDLHR